MKILNYFTENDQTSNFVMLVGAPGSGKTTFAREFVEGMTNKQRKNWVIISPDDVRKELGLLIYRQEDNRKVYAIVYDRLTDILDSGGNVVYDATNCNRKDRNKIMHVVEGFYKKAVCLVSTTDLYTCCTRNNLRGDDAVPNNKLERMYLTLLNNPPHIFEGYDIIGRF